MKAKAPQPQASLRKRIGPALWLWELLVNLISGTWDGKSYVFVAGGQVLSDVQLGIWLDAKPNTIAAWRRRLKAAGLIDWTIKPGVGRVYIASPLAGREFFQGEKPQAIPEAKPLTAPPFDPRKPSTEPLASRFVQ